MYPIEDRIGSVGNMGAYLAQTIPGIGQLTDAIERYGALMVLIFIGMIAILFITRSTSRRSDADAKKDLNDAQMSASLLSQFSGIVNRYLEDSKAWREQQERSISMSQEQNNANLRILAELTEAIKNSDKTEIEGRTVAVADLKATFVGVHEETMGELKTANEGIETIKNAVTNELTAMSEALNGIRDKLPDVADKKDVKEIIDLVDALTRRVDDIKGEVERLKPVPVLPAQEMPVALSTPSEDGAKQPDSEQV